MALTDDTPIRITAPEYRPSGKGDLEQWLAKEAEGGIKPEDNEDKSTTDYQELYERPEGRKDGSNVDGRWGEGPHMANGRQEPFHQNDGTYRRSQTERHEVASQAFATLPAAESADRALLSANFANARSGNFTAHSLLLQGKTKEGASLAERANEILRR